MPDTFIPLAEELGILDIVSGQLFGDACRDAVHWPEDISLTFNFSPSQLSDRTFADAIPPSCRTPAFRRIVWKAENTESALVADLEATRHAIQTLRNAGVRIVIDDFGTGYSRLYHLYELRFDKLKIDRRFIQELVITGESAVFIRAMVGLCRGLNLSVTAEGVETEAQAKAVLEHGVDQAQGFLFGKAVPAAQVPQLFAAPAKLRGLTAAVRGRAYSSWPGLSPAIYVFTYRQKVLDARHRRGHHDDTERGAALHTPVTILTGFLGSGKTTLLNRAMRDPSMANTAVVINEFGEVGLDHMLAAQSDDTIMVLENGCLCCTVFGDLVTTLNNLYHSREDGAIPRFDHVVIETSGLADPSPLIQAFLSDPTLAGLYRIGAVVATVDAVNGPHTLDEHIESVRQVALADHILITKLDLVEPAQGEGRRDVADGATAPAQSGCEDFADRRSVIQRQHISARDGLNPDGKSRRARLAQCRRLRTP